MMKIAHFIDSHDPGGAEALVVDMARKAPDYGYSAEVYHFGNPWLEEKCRQFSIPTYLVPGHRFYTKAVTIPLFTLHFRKFLRERHVDLLHSHLFGSISSACFATFLAGIPHIGTLHDVYTLEEKKNRIRYLSLSSLLNTRLITVSDQMRMYLEQKGRFRKGAVQTIVNGVDLERYGMPEPGSRRPELRLKPYDTVFICVGRLEKIKGHADLIAAFAHLSSLDAVQLLIVGEGPCRADLEHQVEQLGMGNHIQLLGHRDDVPTLLAMADCFILPSYSEGLSCSIIEAMAAGLPILATAVGGNTELVQEGVNGYLVAPGSPEKLTKRIQDVMADAAARKHMGAKSLLRARVKYSLQAMMKQYVATYNQILAKK